jgi:hypothetical protein
MRCHEDASNRPRMRVASLVEHCTHMGHGTACPLRPMVGRGSGRGLYHGNNSAAGLWHRVVGVLTEVRTSILLNTCQRRYRCANPFFDGMGFAAKTRVLTPSRRMGKQRYSSTHSYSALDARAPQSITAVCREVACSCQKSNSRCPAGSTRLHKFRTGYRECSVTQQHRVLDQWFPTFFLTRTP